jgi:hypothetical protein
MDLTAYYAIEAADRQLAKERKEKPGYNRVYICSPLKGEIHGNIKTALRYCRYAVKRGKLPIAPHCYFPLFMDDKKTAERELAMAFGLRLLSGCKEIWVFGDTISDGMKREIQLAKQKGIRIRKFTTNMEEEE